MISLSLFSLSFSLLVFCCCCCFYWFVLKAIDVTEQKGKIINRGSPRSRWKGKEGKSRCKNKSRRQQSEGRESTCTREVDGTEPSIVVEERTAGSNQNAKG